MHRVIVGIFLTFAFAITGIAQSQAIPEFPPISKDSTEQEIKVHLDSIYRYASAEFYKRNYDITLKYGEQALALAKKKGHKHREFKITSVLGNTLLRIKDTTRAKEMFLESIAIAKKEKDTAAIIGSKIDLGNVYNVQNQKAKAIEIFKNVLPFALKTKDTSRTFIINFNVAELYLDDKDIKNADIHLDAVSKYMPLLKSKLYHSGYNLLMGRSWLLKNKPDSAVVRFKKNIDIAIEADYMDGIIEGYTYLIEALELQGDYEGIYKVHQEFDFYNNEKLALEKVAALEIANAKFNIVRYEEKLKATELQNELVKQKAERNKMLFIGVLILAGILSIYSVTLLISFRKRKILLVDLKDKNQKYIEAMDKSEELAAAKSKFFSNISHELRTPLYGIIGISSILMDDESLDHHKEDVTSLKFSADYLLALINDVLQLNKLDATTKEQLNNAPFRLKELISNITKSFEFMRMQNNNVFEITIDDNIPKYINGDRVKLSQILMNLIGNSCKFTENGVIKLLVTKKDIVDNRIELSFSLSDTGIGISKQKQKNIFDEFTQDTLKSHFEGTGLGLPIVKKLLDLHSSDIELISDRGQGTVFNFDISYEMVDEGSVQVSSSKPTNETTIEGKKVLIVDDNRINQIVTQKILDKHGVKSTVADNGAQAISAAQELEIDLILMDINMPGMNGFEATKEIRKFDMNIPIIALTAVEIDEMKQEIFNSGMNDFIVKPYDIGQFLERILENIT